MDEAVLERKYSRADSSQARRRSSTIEPDAPSQDSAKANAIWRAQQQEEAAEAKEKRKQATAEQQVGFWKNYRVVGDPSQL